MSNRVHPKGVRTEVCQSCKLSQYFNLRKVAGRIMIQDGGIREGTTRPTNLIIDSPQKILEFATEKTSARISKIVFSEVLFVMVILCLELEASAPRLQSSNSELWSPGAKLKPRPRRLERYFFLILLCNMIFLIRLENSSTYQIYVDRYTLHNMKHMR